MVRIVQMDHMACIGWKKKKMVKTVCTHNKFHYTRYPEGGEHYQEKKGRGRGIPATFAKIGKQELLDQYFIPENTNIVQRQMAQEI